MDEEQKKVIQARAERDQDLQYLIDHKDMIYKLAMSPRGPTNREEGNALADCVVAVANDLGRFLRGYWAPSEDHELIESHQVQIDRLEAWARLCLRYSQVYEMVDSLTETSSFLGWTDDPKEAISLCQRCCLWVASELKVVFKKERTDESGPRDLVDTKAQEDDPSGTGQ